MPIETTPWDPLEYLDSQEARAAYLKAAFEDGDPRLISAVVYDVGRSAGLAQLVEDAGFSRDTLSDKGDPKLFTLLGVIKALGLRVTVVPAAEAA